MASLVTDILSSAGQLQREELGNKISGLNRRIVDLKNQLQDSLQTRYENFLPNCVKTTELSSKFINYSNEVEELTSLVENELVPQVKESNEEFREIRRQLATAKWTVQVVNRLVEVHDALEASETNFVHGHFTDAVDSLSRVAAITEELVASLGGQVKVLNALKRECTVRREKLIYDLDTVWKNCIAWDVADDKSVRLSIHRSDARVTLADLIQAMDRLDSLRSKLKLFGRSFHKQVLVPNVSQRTDTSLATRGETVTLLLVVLEGTAGPSPKEVFSNLTTVLDFLGTSFGGIEAGESSETTSALRLLGSFVCTDLYDLLIKECLLPAMPTRCKDLDGHKEVINMITAFHGRLVDVGLIGSAEEGGILSYARNVDVTFSNKTCKEILTRARKLMLEELYDSMPSPSSEPPSEDVSKEELSLNKGLLRFPVCQISKSAHDLVRLMYGVMEEATTSTPLCAARLYTTARNVVELYCDVVPSHHKNSLEKLPQLSALLHNNCMYISHHLRTLGHQYQDCLSQSLGNKTVTFVDIIPIVSNVGTRVFLDQMLHQKKQLMNMLGKVGFKNVVSDTESKPAVERSVKQCTLQLQHLQSVWTDVLPRNVYNRAMGTLLNSLVDEIVQRVVLLEDLPADIATYLVAVFSVLKDKAPLLFWIVGDEKHSLEIQRHVPKWPKFLELLLLLAASMASILDRWAEGKGPLAQSFTVDEVKQLMRALFQNTDRRAAVLSKIK